MAVFLISYDTHKQRNYEALYEGLEENDFVRVLESVWIGELTNSHTEVRDWLRGLLDEDDSILVIKLKPKHAKAWRHLSSKAEEILRTVV